ncbi:M10 family metallopeptidase C-terminal domain-containing protein [Romeria aff. gracilis LEGE 07310]|uniref:M10 family metallopeptidase C-terminal domain-containing protein n=1 Tax=Vasconcelosia minhoensis LEGE 07310 TaxID=915328 RepID=A0A8J7DN20_9CYAN|nr:calcium-binding protein [Romeria gracilis]MBE9077570.1 M10 family metallopeptidase C-terminal domain-containing protein [Romeria aff. gracilis LEGE 07310]
MTYRSYVGDPLSGGYSNEAWGYAQSLMMYDIRAIQQMYGANFGHNATGTTYTFSTTTGEMSVNGVGQGTPGGNNIFRTIWDGNGIDTYNFSNYNTNLRVNLAPGGWSDLDVGGNTQRAYLGNGNYARGHLFNALQFNGDTRSLIENAYGGSGNDRIYGNSANNYLRGNDGNDYLYGYDGNDSLNGGSGSDYLSGGTGNDYLYGYDGNDSLYGGSSEDYLSGGNGNDTLRGESGGDRIYGGAGNDWIDGGYGLDRMDGGSGIDTLDVRFWSGIYELDMNTGETNFAGETATNFENVYTGAGNDKITGTSGANSINTGAGNDTLYGENGNDTLTGGKGNDYLVGGLGDDYLNGTDYSAQGTGERDILRSGSFGDRDIFVLGERKGGGRVFYNDNGNSDYALIKDFDVHNFVGDVADKIQLLGSSSSYSIADVSVNGVLGAGINFFGDLIGIVQDFSASSLNLSDSKQFIYV